MGKREKAQNRRLMFIYWFDRIFTNWLCWADCVSWALNRRSWNLWKIDKAKDCRAESMEGYYRSCYCGRFQNGKAANEK